MNKNNSGKNTTPSTAANTAAAAINYHYIQKGKLSFDIS
jgi:hypothetical protein